MRQRVGRGLVALAAVAAVGSLATVSAVAGPRLVVNRLQDTARTVIRGATPEPVRRTPNGPIPRLADGTPDLGGRWGAPQRCTRPTSLRSTPVVLG